MAVCTRSMLKCLLRHRMVGENIVPLLPRTYLVTLWSNQPLLALSKTVCKEAQWNWYAHSFTKIMSTYNLHARVLSFSGPQQSLTQNPSGRNLWLSYVSPLYRNISQPILLQCDMALMNITSCYMCHIVDCVPYIASRNRGVYKPVNPSTNSLTNKNASQTGYWSLHH